MSQKIFDNGLVAICKSKVTLSLVYVCILDLLSKALKYEFHYDYIEKKIWQYFFLY